MKNYKLKKVLLVLLALFATGYSSLSSSHDQSGSLHGPFWSTDVYVVNCSTDGGGATDHLTFSILDSTQTPGGGKINVVGTAQQGIFTQTGDAVRGDANFSPDISMQAGNTSYLLIVHKLKDSGNFKFYTLRFHCISATGAHTGTSLISVQDQ